jgi:uncharacterized protein
MKIGILSDTHLTMITDAFKKTLDTIFADADMIVHAGDMTGMAVYDYLSNWTLRAVRGNMDDHDVRAILPEKRLEGIMGRRVGIIHGRGTPYGIERLVYGEFGNADIIIFGHSHMPLHTKIGNTILFNPGTCSGTHAPRSTAGILEIGDEMRFRHIEIT